MVEVKKVAGYLCVKYSERYNQKIDEMKLHKLLYFVQRESFIRLDRPFFPEVFYGWRFGPVIKEIRDSYRLNDFGMIEYTQFTKEEDEVLNYILDNYSAKDSWSLSRLTHGELSWKNSRKGISEYENSDNPIINDDIRLDAERIKKRREMLKTNYKTGGIYANHN